MTWLKRAGAVAVVLALGIAVVRMLPRGVDYGALHRIESDVRLAELLDRLKVQGHRGTIVFADVSVIDPISARAIAGQSVVVRDGRIDWVGPAAERSGAAAGLVIDGRGKYLSPGLVDMHVHTMGVGEHILRLAAGVTSVRDMDGFPWLLRLRDSIAQGRTPGASIYLAGTIIADHPLSGYAVVVSTPEEARQAVRNQRACGYAFIKVHNRLAQPLFDAVADEAHRAGLDLVGHVPHEISLAHAIQSGRMRTLEHLKGFLVDQTLLPSAEDFAAALAGAETWITPTLYTRVGDAHGDEANRLLADPRMRFAPRASRDEWAGDLPKEGSQRARLGDTFRSTQASVMARLLPLHPRWLAGTDAAGYAFNIAGFALHDELQMLHEAGVPVAEVIRAATSEAAAAMRQGDLGRIAAGMRADLVLLNANPFEDLGAYRHSDGVMARGGWFDRGALDAALDGLATIYAEPEPTRIDGDKAVELVRDAELRAERGQVFESAALLAAASALKNGGQDAAAAGLARLADIPASGPCAAVWPK